MPRALEQKVEIRGDEPRFAVDVAAQAQERAMRREIDLIFGFEDAADCRLDIALGKFPFQQAENAISRDDRADAGDGLKLGSQVNELSGGTVVQDPQFLKHVCSQPQEIRQVSAGARNTGTAKKDHAPFIAGDEEFVGN
jgi:hypothetical protein